MLYLEDKNALEFIPVLEQSDFSFKPLAEIDDLAPVLHKLNGIEDFQSGNLLSHLMGGYILRYQGVDLLKPQCCCDLNNLNDWKLVLSYKEPSWTMHWIGHPWVRVKFDDGYLLFTDYTEAESKKARFAVKPEVLAGPVKQAEKQVRTFAEWVFRSTG